MTNAKNGREGIDYLLKLQIDSLSEITDDLKRFLVDNTDEIKYYELGQKNKYLVSILYELRYEY